MTPPANGGRAPSSAARTRTGSEGARADVMTGAESVRGGRAPSHMEAAVLRGGRAVDLIDAPVPTPGAGAVRVRIEGCGVCASNLAPWEGRPWFEYPFAPGSPGHEAWGSVDAVGEGASEHLLGCRVAFLSERSYAAYDVARADQVVELPPELDDSPFPGEPLACAMNVFGRSEIEEGQRVAVVGVGFLGLLLVQLAARRGAHVTAISRRPYALELAREHGAGETVPLSEPDSTVARVLETTGGEGFARVIEVTGKQAPLEISGALTAERGRLVIAGYHQDGRRSVNLALWNWRGLDVINAHERDPAAYMAGMRAALSAVLDGRLDPFPLLTHFLPLDRLRGAFDLMVRRPDGFLKAVVLP